ncbi:hypothetical protein EN866_34115 [Mesorhizobium sp. M2D.F.Ca.ET.223.01.1.1]|uniref:hypothetical protein n=1 Tax=Mesorhizobium sp. M2D.F.Ca.ET.223.01.1.1 TaxID=2563940 RepID=UPI0010924189|nr:hypothetical protein [Mesorhizobium sp. M2D.F.Ca.ET.223.01.1.1]TGR83548.1 hypothetical protein EN866_34115 [Mesorhizobium sp. M2D.F.Ca.ET.223.01.1.1]TGT63350.1 hypothetical protein EN802_33135 [bacterium M00.F.Ca.ET.159.01.1.1]
MSERIEKLLRAEIDTLRGAREEMKAELSRLREAEKRYREALAPFPDASSLAKVYAHLTRQDAQAARRALQEGGDNG